MKRAEHNFKLIKLFSDDTVCCSFHPPELAVCQIKGRHGIIFLEETKEVWCAWLDLSNSLLGNDKLFFFLFCFLSFTSYLNLFKLILPNIKNNVILT